MSGLRIEQGVAVVCEVLHGDCLDRLRDMPDNSVDAIVTDPPYGLSNTTPDKVADTIVRWASGEREHVPEGRGFMGRPWDAFVPPPAVWDECLRVLKPGGHMAVFAGSRTQDLMGMSIRLAGFELRDSLAWIYGSGFPKSMDVSKAIDKVNGEGDRLHKFTAYMRTTGLTARQLDEATETSMGGHYLTAASQPAIPTPALWAKIRPMCGDVPAWVDELVDRIEAEREVLVARQAKDRRSDGTVIGLGHAGSADITAPATPEAERWAGWGTALKPAQEPIILARKPLDGTVANNVLAHGVGGLNIDACRVHAPDAQEGRKRHGGGNAVSPSMMGPLNPDVRPAAPAGRFPANVLLDEHAAAEMDRQSGVRRSSGVYEGDGVSRSTEPHSTNFGGKDRPASMYADSGGASRFFPVFKYQAKAPKKERPVIEREDGTRVSHPTVKPLALLDWLVTLITPPGGVVLDPFAGSGTTLEAARDKGFRAVGIEADADHVALIHERLKQESGEPDLFTCGSNR